MSVAAAEKELEEFLKSGEAGVFVLKGKWGTGKTYLVQDVVKKRQASGENKKYAYVSLFGVSSVEALTEAIFVDMLGSTDDADTSNTHLRSTEYPSLTKAFEVKDATKNWFKKNRSDLARFFEGMGSRLGLPSGTISIPMELLAKAWVSKVIFNSKIVIDDIERKGDGLSIKDLLGFLSQLKEQKSCQIVLIFNEKELGEDAQKEFDKLREKVVDREIELAPSIDEIIKLGFKKNNPVAVEVLRQLEVDNIRAVQKVRKFLDRLESAISHLSPEAQNQVVSSAIRLSWFYFMRDKDGTIWKFIEDFKDYTPYALRKARVQVHGEPRDLSQEELKKRQEEERIAQQLYQYGYQRTGSPEKMLIKALEQGFHGEAEFNKVLSDIDEAVKVSRANGQLDDAWNIFYSSFMDDEQKFVYALLECFRKQSAYYEPFSLGESMSVLEELGRKKEAQEIFGIYFSVPHVFDQVYEDMKLDHLKHPKVRSKVEELIEKAWQPKDMLRLVEDFVNDKLRRRDFIALQARKEDDWMKLFKEDLKGNDILLYHVIGIINRSGLLKEYREIAREAAKALKKIAAENKMNELRLAEFKEDIERLAEPPKQPERTSQVETDL